MMFNGGGRCRAPELTALSVSGELRIHSVRIEIRLETRFDSVIVVCTIVNLRLDGQRDWST